jgi:hypothetical protein
LQARYQQEEVGAYEVGFLYAALEKKDEAFKWLEAAYQKRDPGLTFLKIDPNFDALWSDSRFADLERRVGLRR